LPATVTTPEWTVILTVPEEPVELYHLPSDLAQARNVAREQPEVVEELRNRFIWLARGGRDVRAVPDAEARAAAFPLTWVGVARALGPPSKSRGARARCSMRPARSLPADP
jgi:hypothetical protein